MKKLLLATTLIGFLFSFQSSYAAGEHRRGLASEQSKESKIERKVKKFKKKLEKKITKSMDKLDTSGDDKIDLSEYLIGAEKRFNETDLNSDGYITAEEMRERGNNVLRKARNDFDKAVEK